jgi:PDZ domain-containing protein
VNQSVPAGPPSGPGPGSDRAHEQGNDDGSVGSSNSTSDGPTARKRGRAGAWRLTWVLGLAMVVLLVGFLWRLPYYTLSPGSMRATQPLVQISGAPTFPDATGEIGYLTVTFGQSTPFGLLRGWLDDDVEVLNEQDALGGRDRDESREINRQLMSNAKDVAAAVALDALGYDVQLVGTGAVVVGVEPGTPADGALEPGDTVVSVNGTPVTTSRQFTDVLAALAPGDQVVLGVQSHTGGMVAPADQVDAPPLPTTEVVVTLASRPDDPGLAYLGVRTGTRDGAYDLPFPVEIDSGNVIGPSAGLAFTLAIIDMLTPGNLSGGLTVAVTGTIAPNGDVGRVGGVPQKAAAAIAAGATVYLVPVDEAEQARQRAGDDMEVYAVANLSDALDVLARLSGDASVRDLAAANGVGV